MKDFLINMVNIDIPIAEGGKVIIKSNFGRWYAETPYGELCFDHEPIPDEITRRMEELIALELAMQESTLLLEAEDGIIV